METTGARDLVQATALRYGVDPALAMAVAYHESGFNQGARSGAGAIGVMQLMAPTAADMKVNPYTLAGNVEGGVKYLSYLLGLYGGNVEKTLWAYNAGPGNVADGIKPAETRRYIPRVMGAYADFGGYQGGGFTGGETPTASVDLFTSESAPTLLVLAMALAGAYIIAS